MNAKSSQYVDKCRRDYSMFVLCHRALPSLADGLASSSRRIMWTAKGKNKIKSATLAGATLPLHPHAPPDDVVCTLAAPYGNNYPLLTGYGSFGTLLEPTGYGSTRYTSVEVSEFAKEVLFVDFDIVPLVPNYDNTLKEPKHFLPLIPLCLINPSFGLAIGYSSTILPRSISDIVDSQIKYLNGVSERKQPGVVFYPSESVSSEATTTTGNKSSWHFEGTFTRGNRSNLITITRLPYGIRHENYRETLQNLKDSGIIKTFVDDSSSKCDISVILERGISSKSDDELLSILKLRNVVHENINLVDPDQTRALSYDYHTVIKEFTEWRLSWFVERYNYRRAQLEIELTKCNDIILAIQHEANKKVSVSKNRNTFKTWLKQIGVLDTDYVASLPTYRYTREEVEKQKSKKTKIEQQINECETFIQSLDARKRQYIKELKEIKKKFSKPLPV